MSIIAIAKGFFLLLKLANAGFEWLEKRGHINEGMRRQIAIEHAAGAKSAKAAGLLRDEIEGMTDDQVDDILAS